MPEFKEDMKMKVALTKEFNGKKEIELDLESLTGKDLLLAEKQARMKGDQSAIIFLSMQYQTALAAKLAGVSVKELEALPAVDFRNIVMPVVNFLFSQD